MGNIKSVLFVCTGNSCRSPMAEGLLKKYLKDLGKSDIRVESAGLVAIDGFPATDETIDVTRKENIDLSGFRSRKLTEEIIKNSDLILTMEAGHKNIVIRMVPEAASKTFLLKEFKTSDKGKYPENLNIPDPIGKPIDYYMLSYEIIKGEIKRIAKLL